MGLALHDSLGSYPSLTEHHHDFLPPGSAEDFYTGFFKETAFYGHSDDNGSKDVGFPSAKAFHRAAWSRSKICSLAQRHELHAYDADWGTALRPHQLAAVAASHRHTCRNAACSATNNYGSLFGVKKARIHRRCAWQDEAAEGRELAASAAALPGDESRSRRPPSLERQEAFRDAKTVKRAKHSAAVSAVDLDGNDDEAVADMTQSMMDSQETAELYRLGLLYDDEHERGSGFGLAAIDHDEPVYSLSVREDVRRGRKRKAGRGVEWDGPSRLPLDLSFAALGDDSAIARFLISPEPSELDVFDENDEEDTAPCAKPAVVAGEKRKRVDLAAQRSPGSSQVGWPLQVIYEQDESAFITHDVLVPDIEGGYASHSDSGRSEDGDEAHDTHSLAKNDSNDLETPMETQMEEDAIPGVSDFPDLISDSEADSNDWALLPSSDEHEEEEEEDNDDIDQANPNAWVVLG